MTDDRPRYEYEGEAQNKATGVDMQAEYWTWEEAATYGGVTRQTMQAWMKGRARRARLGKRRLVAREDVMTVVEEKRTPQPYDERDG